MTKIARFGEIGNWRKSLEDISMGNEDAKNRFFYRWAERPVQLSEGFFFEDYPASKKFDDGDIVIEEIMRQVDSMFVEGSIQLKHEYLAKEGFRAYLLDRFKDPGFLHHCVFWDFGNDPTAIAFEWFHFRGENQLRLEMLRGKIFWPQVADADQSPWKHLVDLYHDRIKHYQEDDPGWKLFVKVLGWPPTLS